MSDDERVAPDSFKGKVHELFNPDDEEDGSETLETDAGAHVPASPDEAPSVAPKRPTDPPF
jgi:hypothetical protein